MLIMPSFKKILIVEQFQGITLTSFKQPGPDIVKKQTVDNVLNVIINFIIGNSTCRQLLKFNKK